MKILNPSTAAIVVTFKPEPIRLERLLEALKGQVLAIIVVDNGSTLSSANTLSTFAIAELIGLSQNMGIATAQNVGIERARALGCDYVILFDQDSAPPRDLVDHLVCIAEHKREQGETIAAVGPSFRDVRLDKTSRFLRTEGFRTVLQTQDLGDVVQVDHLIASGCLIPIAALDIVGGMRDELFIDYVDTEWSLRAEYQHGLLSYGTFGVTLDHELGQTPISVLGRNYAIHSPVRHYYLVRNSIWLWGQTWVPLNWKLARLPRLVLRLGFNLIFARPLLAHWRMIGLGLWHGISGRMGKHADS